MGTIMCGLTTGYSINEEPWIRNLSPPTASSSCNVRVRDLPEVLALERDPSPINRGPRDKIEIARQVGEIALIHIAENQISGNSDELRFENRENRREVELLGHPER
jgi:hypothetical protein